MKLASKTSKTEPNKFEKHATALAEAKEKAEQFAQARGAALQRVAWIESQFKNGYDTVTAAEYAEALAEEKRAKLLADFGATMLVKRVNAAAPWDPIEAEAVQRTLTGVFPGVSVEVVDRQPSGFESPTPTIYLWQLEGGKANHTGSTTGTVHGRFMAPEWAAGLRRQPLDKALSNTPEGWMKMHGFDGREFTIDAGGVFPLLPTLAGTPNDKDALSVADALASRVTASTKVYQSNGDPRIRLATTRDGRPTVAEVTKVVATAKSAEVKSAKVNAGKRTVVADLVIESHSSPLYDHETNPVPLVEAQADWLKGRAFAGLGRVAEVQVITDGGRTTFTITAESAA